MSPNIADYNNFVTANAALHPDLPTASWHAIVSTQGGTVDGVVYDSVWARNNAINYAGVPVYNTRGERVCDGEWNTWGGLGARSDLYNASNDNHYAQIYDPNGNPIGVQYVATGSYWSGSPKYAAGRPPGSEGWPLTDCYITVGLPDQINDYWIDRQMDFGNFSSWDFPFYALSSVVTVPVPEPSTFVLLGIGAFGLLARTWRRSRKVV